MTETLKGLEGTEVYMDDILVYGERGDPQHLEQVVKVIEAARLKLNKSKCKFKQRQIRFLGNIHEEKGVRPDPKKLAGIENFPQFIL